ncbi:MAG: OmpA family protein, partial [Bacteroidota bacterium]
PYTYQWDNGETTLEASRLAPGEHRVTVMDAKGCTVFTTVTITENILALSANLEQTSEIKCNGETTAGLNLSIKGGKAPFDLKWNQSGLSGEQLSNLGAGNYEVVITDVSGQTTTASRAIKAPTALSAEIVSNGPASTEISSDGRAKVKATGGTAPYTFLWDTEETGEAAEKLPQGMHKVEVKDANGCQVSLDFETKRKIIPALTARNLRRGQTVRLEKLYFDADSSSIKPESIPVLDELYEFLKENGSIVIQIGGHTNNIPSHEFCDRLSTARAEAVARYITQKGIDPKRVLAKGYGKRKPVFTNKTKEGRRKNQRVEVKILSI